MRCCSRLLLARLESACCSHVSVPIFVDSRQIKIPLLAGELTGLLQHPKSPTALVVLVHGSAGSRPSFRCRKLGRALSKLGFSTLQLDLLISEDIRSIHSHDGLDVLADRVTEVLCWIERDPELSQLPLCLLGAGNGAAIVIEAANSGPNRVVAIICCDGRPDWVFESLASLDCPILLLVGELAVDLLELNAWSTMFLRARHELAVIPGVHTLLVEPLAVEQVAELSARWIDSVMQPADSTCKMHHI